MKKIEIMSLNLGVALISFAVLTLELALIRVMDVILAPNTGYMVLTSAMFALGLGGIYLYLFPAKEKIVLPRLSRLALIFSLCTPLVIVIFNYLPFSMEITKENQLMQLAAWAVMYITLVIPFLIVGLILAQVFLSYSKEINRLYFFDLLGAGLACLFFIPLIPYYGPGGLLFVASSAGFLASFCFHRPNRVLQYAVPVAAIIAIITPLLPANYIEFRGHANKRNNDQYILDGKRDFVQWDPVSKLDVLNINKNAKLFSLDGGQQGSWLEKFDGDMSKLIVTEDDGEFYYGRRSAIHYLFWKEHRTPEVLEIGSASGGGLRTPLAFSAKHIDAIELVGAMVNAERTMYSEYSGAMYSHPDVTAIIGEGRSYLRSTDKAYDIIQMFSSHTSSSVESGSGAVQTVYLQTVEAYIEYFQHLTENGALQINHHIYPRMLTTAAQAWHLLGKTDFWRHALVIEPLVADTLPTTIIKMQPWTSQEVELVKNYMNRGKRPKLDRPLSSHPSHKYFAEDVYTTSVVQKENTLEGVEFRIGTYHQQSLPYDILVTIQDNNGKVLRSSVIEGATITDNAFVKASFEPLADVKGKEFIVEISGDHATRENGFAIWLAHDDTPVLNTLPAHFLDREQIAFNPLEPDSNLVSPELLSSPFPEDMAKDIPWNISPVYDASPYFSMIRKYNQYVEPGAQNVIDGNTAHLLNVRLRDGLPKDWLHLFVVASVSIFFAFVFIVLPFIKTSWKKNTWPGMGRDILYFSCLGLGFISIEVVLIQLFKKLIGYPSHTFVVVICCLLISAGIGSAFSKRFIQLAKGRMYILFSLIIGYGILFTITYESIFYTFLGMPLSSRILVATLLISPLGFFLGMPFPLGILGLSNKHEQAIPWAWAVNGFFTVVGGFVAIIVSIAANFSAVLLFAFVIYGIALFASQSKQQLDISVSL